MCVCKDHDDWHECLNKNKMTHFLSCFLSGLFVSTQDITCAEHDCLITTS